MLMSLSQEQRGLPQLAGVLTLRRMLYLLRDSMTQIIVYRQIVMLEMQGLGRDEDEQGVHADEV